MFAKLLKYEWKANVKLLSLLSGCVLGIGCISAIVLRLLTGNWDAILESDTGPLLLIPSFFFLFAAYMAILLYGACVQYILLYRFYKSRFTDEGYLMFTLPVKTSHLFLSNALNMAIWSAIAVTVIILSLGIAIGLGPVWSEDFSAEIKFAFDEMALLGDIVGPGYGITGIITLIAMWSYSIVAPMTAVVLGASVAKKHKVLTIIGILIAISMVISTINGIISGMASLLTFTSDNIHLITTLPFLLESVVFLGFTIGGYFLSIHIMKRKLNLP